MTITDSITVPVPPTFLTIAADVHGAEGAEVTRDESGAVVRVVVTNAVTGAVCTLVPELRIPEQRRGES